MTEPRRYLVRMLVFLVIVLSLGVMIVLPLRDAFMANAPLNGLIVAVLLVGIIYNFRQVRQLYPEVAWIESFRSIKPPLSQPAQPRLLASMATMVEAQNDRLNLSAPAMRSLLDGIQSRLEESRDLSRYTIGLLIFLGLLGTFWGLLQTIDAISDVIGGLTVTSGDVAVMFDSLKTGLAAPMEGMGTAFSSSLFGLGGSLMLGFLDLQAGQAQNRFFNELEDWLSVHTRLSSSSIGGEGEQSVPAFVQALLEQTADSLENLQRTLVRGEEGRIATDSHLVAIADKMGSLSDHISTQQSLMKALVDGQLELRPVLAKLADSTSSGGMDEASQKHIRNLDVYMTRMLEEMVTSRNEILQSMRSEIKMLARTIAAVADDANRR